MQRATILPLLILLATTAVVPQTTGAAATSNSRAEALRTISELSDTLSQLDKIHADIIALNEKMSAIHFRLTRKTAEVAKLAAAPGVTLNQLVEATKQMEAEQMSFNLQYLQLQNSMQNENRSFTMVSNIMKTKHDTVKNSISNIR